MSEVAPVSCMRQRNADPINKAPVITKEPGDALVTVNGSKESGTTEPAQKAQEDIQPPIKSDLDIAADCSDGGKAASVQNTGQEHLSVCTLCGRPCAC
jgi:hypothetical protein